ncbi:MAG: transglycosylase SLT domain-containing protein [Wenzhouxiangellaceae bacterium]|nr:transglycosylase SLT domain-containing protein [Wenzhouxiangellaceae bacterium]MBS3823837.1 transglycosylase SLT domain-containing protein [Wenzhouxiangellaceae bacterium]
MKKLRVRMLLPLSSALAFVVTTLVSDPITAEPVDEHAEARAVFERAWTQAGRGNVQALAEAIERIPDYPLTPYLRFELKRQTLDRQNGSEMERFLATYGDWSFATNLERQWLKSLARSDDHEGLLRYGTGSSDAEVRCRIARARLARDQSDGIERRARKLWLSPVSQPSACDPLFDWWKRQGNPDADTAWQRFGMAIEAGELSLARYLKRYLDPADRELADGWLRIAARPAAGLAAAVEWSDLKQARQLMAWGLKRLARNDWQRADALYRRLGSRFSFNADEIGPALREIALFRAVDLDADAVDAIDGLGARWIDQQMLEWRLRAALANQQWREVLESVQRMPAGQQLRERWRYWRARALAELGRPEAGLTYATLATESDYYGFLAALRSNQPLTLCSRELAADGEAQRRLLRDAEFARAVELYRAGLSWHARWTFERVSRRLSANEQRQAALLAAALGWHDRAIVSLGRSGAMDAYPWRFPVVERELVSLNASRRGVAPSLIMGLMRAESAMQADARSHAGARGLLQLMDPTARLVARRNGLQYNGALDLYEPERNIALGVAHLGELQERFDGDWTLVAAAYNAGAGNAERWQRERPDLPRDIWIETLPFFETRDYIPRVLAFATIYEWQLGESPSVLADNLLGQTSEEAAFACPTT